MEKNKKVSTKEPINEDASGAINHVLLLKISKTCTSNNCANKKAVPDPTAILMDIRSSKFVEKYSVKDTPVKKPK